MSREFVVVPKQKYESMIRSLEEGNNSQEPKERIEPNQEGGQSVKEQRNTLSEQIVKNKRIAPDTFDMDIPHKSPYIRKKTFVKNEFSFQKKETSKEKTYNENGT